MVSFHGKTLVRNFKQIVLDTYGIRLKVHQGFSMGQTADDDATVAKTRSDGANEPSGSFTLWSTMSVQEAEDAIRNGMGFAVQVLDASGANADNSATLRAVGFRSSQGAAPASTAPSERPSSPTSAWAHSVPPGTIPSAGTGAVSAAGPAKSKVAAGVLGILAGTLGVHNFYLGYTGKGLAQLLISLLSCGALAVISSIWGLIEGIMILTGSIKCDARGVPLRD